MVLLRRCFWFYLKSISDNEHVKILRASRPSTKRLVLAAQAHYILKH